MPELDRRHRMVILAICCTSLFIVGLDNTIVNLALPSIGRDLHASVSGLQWTIDAYTLVLASLLMLAGSTGDRIGRRRVFQTGLVLFSVGSLLCSVAPDVGTLIVFRILQAVGGSMLNPVALSIITNTFTDRRERAKAFGVWGGVVGLSWALGPLVGGALVDSIGWRSVFWINVPIGVAAVLLAARFVPESRAATARPLDPIGQLLLMVLLATLTFSIIEAPALGWRSHWIIGCLVVTAVSAVAFVVYEKRKDQPLLDMRFFASVPFSGATLIAVSSFGVLSGFLFLNALYLQEVRAFSPLHAGLLMLPMAAMTGVLAPISGRIVGSRGPRLPMLAGGLGIAAGSLLLSGLTADSSIEAMILAYVVFGIGFGFINPPITNAAVSGMPVSRAGVAAAVASTSRQVGATLGVAVLGSVVTGHVVGPLSTGFVAAAHPGWLIMVGAGVLIVVLGLLTTGKRALRTAQVFDGEAAPTYGDPTTRSVRV